MNIDSLTNDCLLFEKHKELTCMAAYTLLEMIGCCKDKRTGAFCTGR
jgi:hypothetical protein